MSAAHVCLERPQLTSSARADSNTSVPHFPARTATTQSAPAEFDRGALAS